MLAKKKYKWLLVRYRLRMCWYDWRLKIKYNFYFPFIFHAKKKNLCKNVASTWFAISVKIIQNFSWGCTEQYDLKYCYFIRQWVSRKMVFPVKNEHLTYGKNYNYLWYDSTVNIVHIFFFKKRIPFRFSELIICFIQSIGWNVK